jgi:hypothetical protein
MQGAGEMHAVAILMLLIIFAAIVSQPLKHRLESDPVSTKGCLS